MLNDFYRSFEDKYRGNRELIKTRLEVYLPFIETMKLTQDRPKIIDLGCGRGEWLELLIENACDVTGVDLDEGMLKDCIQRGFDVKQQDAIKELKSLTDNSISIVTGFHIVEHLPFEVLQSLIQEALRVLIPGGLLILETPNPENLKVASEYFYMDPTHIKPIPSNLLSFLTEYYGFSRTKVLRLQETKDLVNNENIYLKDVLDGVSPDYAVVAQKDGNKDILDEFNELFLKEYGLSLDTLLNKFQTRVLNVEKNINDRITQSESKAMQIEQHLFAILNSKSWKITKPLREFRKFLNWFLLGSYSWITFSSGSRPRRVAKKILIKIKHYIKSNPKLKYKLKYILNKFPNLIYKLNKIVEEKYEYNLKNYTKKENFLDIDNILLTDSKIKSFKFRDNILNSEIISNKIERIIIDGHFNGTYSLASVNRNIVNRILEDENLKINMAIIPRENVRVNTITSIPGKESELIKFNNLVFDFEKNSIDSDKTIQLFHHYPLVKDINYNNGLAVVMFFWEESKVPQDIIDTLNIYYKGVIVTSWFVKKVLIDSGCILPISIVIIPLVKRNNINISKLEDFKRVRTTNILNILHVSSCFPRKGIDILLKAFNLSCKSVDNLTLTIKTFHNPHNNIKELIDLFIEKEFANKINLIFDDYDDEMMSNLYKNSDIVVLPTRGEGLNMPAIEAGEYTLPLVVTGFGAHTDFTNDNVWKIPYQFSKSQSHFSLSSSVWVDASYGHLSDILVKLSNTLMKNDAKVLTKIEKFHNNIDGLFYSSHSVNSFLTGLVRIKDFNNLDLSKNSNLNSISIITTWNIECGIAEYSKYIANEFIDLNYEVNIFCSTETIENSDDKIKYNTEKTFEQGSPLDISKINFTSKVIWIQHHFAFFPLDNSLSTQIETIKKDNKDFYITLHTTKPLLYMVEDIREEARLCLNQMDRIFVHTIDDLNNLKRVGLIHNVVLVPQGISLYEKEYKNENVNKTDFTIACFGFLYPHKGASKLIEAFAKFVKIYPNSNVKLKLLMTVKNDYKTINELEYCKKIIDALSIKDYVEWHTEFLEIEVIKENLQDSDCVILPYQYTEESSSAASRMVLSICDCVAVTPAPIFDDIRDCCITLNGFEKDDIFNFIVEVYEGLDEKLVHKLKESRYEWINQNNWSSIVKSYDGIFKSISLDKNFLNSSS